MANITIDHHKQVTTDCVLLEVQSIRCQQPLASTEGALSDRACDGLVEQNLSFSGQNLKVVKLCSHQSKRLNPSDGGVGSFQ